jgi:hypothetical protein
MDRVIVYDGALLQTTDVLNTNKFALLANAHQNRSILGTNTVVSGLACTPTSPTADLHVNIGVGAIYQMDPTDQSAYGDLGTDSTNIMKQGILNAPIVLTITPPGTAGFSQVFLVEAILNDVDAGQTALSYYNSAIPTQPYSGPSNSGSSNFTTRTCPCVIALKAGVAATTGTQTTPAPDAGYVGLYAVTVANGQTQITSPNIAQVASAPFFPTLPSVPLNVLNGAWVYAGIDSGVANAYVITFVAGQAIPTSYVAGMEVVFKALNTNTLASTINVNGLGVVPIKRGNVIALAANDIISGSMIRLTFDGTNFQMTGYLGTGTNTNTVTQAGIPYIADSGTQNALIGTYSPAITVGTQVAGLTIAIKLANTITGACTINCNGLGLKNVLTGDLANPPNGVFVAGEVLILEYDGTQYQIVNTSSLTFRKPSANIQIFVNGALGNDANDGISNTSGHALQHIQAGINLAWSYAPSQFTITVVVEPGTYNEFVLTPSWAGPNVIIDGLVAASVTVNSGNNNCIEVIGPNTLTVKNLTLQNSGVYPYHGLIAAAGATINNQNTVSNTIGGGVLTGAYGATVNVGTHTFSGSCYIGYWASFGGTVILSTQNLGGGNQTISGPISVANAMADASAGGSVYVITSPAWQPAFTGAAFVSGKRYSADPLGSIVQAGLGVNYFPGTVAGTVAALGNYQP